MGANPLMRISVGGSFCAWSFSLTAKFLDADEAKNGGIFEGAVGIFFVGPFWLLYGGSESGFRY